MQLVQGVAGTGGEFGDPVEAALAWQEQGAEWLHLVDLDAAFGRGSNAELLARIVGTLDIDVEMSGGIRDAETLERALATGCRRVNLGTAALEDPEWTARAIAEHGDRVAVGLDVRGTTLAARGWTREGGDLWETLARLDAEGCARYVVTDVAKDGMLQGPNLGLLRDVCARTDRPVVASGGVSTLDDVVAIRGLVADGRRGRHHRLGALPGRLHAARGARRGGPPVSDHDHAPTATTTARARPTPREVPWAGRDLSPSGFETDTGAADPALLAALAHPRRRPRPDAGRRGEPVRRARRRRAHRDRRARASTSSTTQVDMAAVTLVAPDGQRALPVFSGVEALAAWDPAARPVPVTPARAGQAAVSEGCDVIVVDVAGPATRVLRPVDGLGPGPAAALGAAAHRPVRRPQRRGGACATRTTSPPTSSRRATRAARACSASCSTCAPGSTPSRCAASPPGWGSGSPPTASCGPGSTAWPSGCAERQPAARFRWMPSRW